MWPQFIYIWYPLAPRTLWAAKGLRPSPVRWPTAWSGASEGPKIWWGRIKYFGLKEILLGQKSVCSDNMEISSKFVREDYPPVPIHTFRHPCDWLRPKVESEWVRRPSESITLKCCNLNVNEAIDKDADGIQIPRGNVSSLEWQVPKVLLKSFWTWSFEIRATFDTWYFWKLVGTKNRRALNVKLKIIPLLLCCT